MTVTEFAATLFRVELELLKRNELQSLHYTSSWTCSSKKQTSNICAPFWSGPFQTWLRAVWDFSVSHFGYDFFAMGRFIILQLTSSRMDWSAELADRWEQHVQSPHSLIAIPVRPHMQTCDGSTHCTFWNKSTYSTFFHMMAFPCSCMQKYAKIWISLHIFAYRMEIFFISLGIFSNIKACQIVLHFVL